MPLPPHRSLFLKMAAYPHASTGSRAKRWVFTLNNWTQEEHDHLCSLAPNVEYLVFGKELAPDTGTPHLQGYVEFPAAVRLTTCKNRLGSARFHVAVARASAQENRTYCTKEGDFEEFGECPTAGQGRRTDLDRFFEWTDDFATNNGRPPTTPEIARSHPTIAVRFPRVLEVVRLRCERSLFHVGPTPRPWQSALYNELMTSPDDRKITFVVDPDGGAGKSWFVRWFLDQHPADTQLFRPARVQDLAHAIRIRTKYFFFDVPRNGMQFLQFQVLEQLKDRLIFSPKYNSTTKMLTNVPHVVVFCNEEPQGDEMTLDRYHDFDLTEY